MTKRRDIISNIAAAARKAGLSWELAREGANHTVYSLDGLLIPIARHKEITKGTTEAIYRECAPKLGRGMVAVSTYHVRVERDEKHWMLHVPEIDRVTQARNLRDVEPMARDLIAVMEEIPPDSFDLEINVVPPASVAAHLQKSKELSEQAAAIRSSAAAESRKAALELHRDGIPLRDVGALLGVSFQRAHQLVSEATELQPH